MKLMVLSGLVPGKSGRVVECQCNVDMTRRLEELGMIPGTVVTCLHKSPSGSPAAFDIQGAIIALRRVDTERIWVEGVT